MKRTALLTALLLSACAAAPAPSADKTDTVDIFKPDGSRQCEAGSISLDTMQSQLAGIKVYAARKDFLSNRLFPAVCGGGTGGINVYRIGKTDLPRAQERGFALLPEQRNPVLP